jgi:hypothetical protein
LQFFSLKNWGSSVNLTRKVVVALFCISRTKSGVSFRQAEKLARARKQGTTGRDVKHYSDLLEKVCEEIPVFDKDCAPRKCPVIGL